MACQEEDEPSTVTQAFAPRSPVGVVKGFGEQHLLAAKTAAAVLDGVDLVSIPTCEDCYDGKLDWCGDEPRT